MKAYLVGGAVRDELLGVSSKDYDYTVVLPPGSYADPFRFMVEELEKMGFEVFLESPQFLTARARAPKGNALSVPDRMTADFVLARKESGYSDGRRPDEVQVGDLDSDLRRRDFTMNAVAKDPATGDYIDPFSGQVDIEMKLIRAVGDPLDRLAEDALRAVRALRFSVTKGFDIDPSLAFAMEVVSVLRGVEATSDERIDVELKKMFAFDTLATLDAFSRFPALTKTMLSGNVRLTSTMKQGSKR